MALPPYSGLISNNSLSISMIKAELSTSNNSLRGLSAMAGFSTPDAMSEFYGYSAVPIGSYTLQVTNNGIDTVTLYVNGSYYSAVGASGIMNTYTVTSPGTIEIYGYHTDYLQITVYTNGYYTGTYGGYYNAYANVSTSAGNTYTFVVTAAGY